jgi:Flp pilus assembly protein protease CpaA
MRTGLTVATLLALLALCVGVALWAWREIGDVPISTHGLIAIGLGAALTFLLGAGLMALMFFSSRRGYDDRAHDADPTTRALRRSSSQDGADPDEGAAS